MMSFHPSTVSTKFSHIHCDIIKKAIVNVHNTQRTFLVLPGLRQIQLKMALYILGILFVLSWWLGEAGTRLNALITHPLSERFKGQEHSQLKKRINRSKVSSLMNKLVTFETNRVLSSDNIHNKE